MNSFEASACLFKLSLSPGPDRDCGKMAVMTKTSESPVGNFKVVTDIEEISRLNDELNSRLSSAFKVRRTREISYPVGHFLGEVNFESASGSAVRAWAHFKEDGKLINLLLVGDPASSASMQMEVQMNFPADTYNRRMAGAFVTDENGDFLIAHRGKLTKGKSGLKKERVFREFASRTVEAQDQDLTSKVILISALDAPDLADRLWGFAIEAREVATRISLEDDEGVGVGVGTLTGGERRGGSSKSKPSQKDTGLKLRDYFDEYAGKGNSKGYGGGKRTVEHGDVVKALESHLRAKGSSQKAQAIDLAIVAEQVDLFEVKTSAQTTDVYTGVGQLLIHGECISELLELPVRRYLVLPSPPRAASHGKHIANKAGINIVIVTYKKSGPGYNFEGIE